MHFPVPAPVIFCVSVNNKLLLLVLILKLLTVVLAAATTYTNATYTYSSTSNTTLLHVFCYFLRSEFSINRTSNKIDR